MMVRLILVALALMSVAPAVGAEWLVEDIPMVDGTTQPMAHVLGELNNEGAELWVYCETEGVIGIMFDPGPGDDDIADQAVMDFVFEVGRDVVIVPMFSQKGERFGVPLDKVNPVTAALTSNKGRTVVISEQTGVVPARSLSLYQAKPVISEFVSKCP